MAGGEKKHKQLKAMKIRTREREGEGPIVLKGKMTGPRLMGFPAEKKISQTNPTSVKSELKKISSEISWRGSLKEKIVKKWGGGI